MHRLSDYDYELPPDLIAQTPLADRAASRLLWLHRDTGQVEHRHFRDVSEILRPDDLLVMNDTRVTARRLLGHKPTGAAVELLVLRRCANGQYEVLAKPGKRLQPGAVVELENGLRAAIVENRGEGRKTVLFEGNGDIDEVIGHSGAVPLPPYIHESLADEERYQTVYARAPGSAAAPTAGLHFTSEILRTLRSKGIQTAFVTLDVGLDTFRPVTSENLEEHVMHGEVCSVPDATAQVMASCKGRVIAVGTTSVRTLETFACGKRALRAGSTTSTLFIRPGFDFQIVDGMFTNFHMPRTTMLVMLAAFAGREYVMAAYEEAISERYRFLSFGDSMLIL